MVIEHRKTRKTRMEWIVLIQMARRQRPLLKGVPREWRGMYTAGGASTNIATAYKDFWYLFSDTYPPASPYPSERGDSRWRSVGRQMAEYGKICDYGTSKNTKKGVGDYWRLYGRE